MLVFIASPPNHRKANRSINHFLTGSASLTHGRPFPCPGIAGCISFTLRMNDARLTN